MNVSVRNNRIGLATIICCYVALIFYILTLFISIEVFGKDNIVQSYILTGFFLAFLFTSGILFLISLILNISQAITEHKVSKGFTFTLISIPPIFACFLVLTVKALTEGH